MHTELSDPLSITVETHGPRRYNLVIQTPSGEVLGKFDNIDTVLANPKEVYSTLGERLLRTTVIPQSPNPYAAPSTANVEKLHVFHNGHKYTLAIPSPQWLLLLGDEVRATTKGGLRAPMPSLIVDVKVEVDQAVKKGQAIVVLESMKTETVLRAEEDGIVKFVACKKGDMVEEGKELVSIEAQEVTSESQS
jgi:3-methylcrotonyl-CoA carboxylase alpha subunit